MTKQITPALNMASFTCPHCGAHANQTWHQLNIGGPTLRMGGARVDVNREPSISGSVSGQYQIDFLVNLNLTLCFSCKRCAIWVFDKIVWPATSLIITPEEDIPADVRTGFFGSCCYRRYLTKRRCSIASTCCRTTDASPRRRGKKHQR